MPAAVRVTLAFDPEPRKELGLDKEDLEKPGPPPLIFQTVVRLELADRIVAGASPDSGQPGGQSPQGGRQ
jgi:hypothetical protein